MRAGRKNKKYYSVGYTPKTAAAKGLTLVSDVVQFPGGKGSRSGGDGPEEPMLDARVARLEDDMKEVKLSLRSIEAKVNSIAESVAEMKGRIGGVEGRLSGIDARFGSLPTTWTILTITFTTWAIGSGILIFALNALRK